MMSLSRMIPLSLAAIGLCTSGCSTLSTSPGNQSRSARAGDVTSFEEANASGARSPNRSQPTHIRGVRPGDAMHYYTNQRIAMVARPARYNASELARVEVWWTENNGFHWHKAGRFEQAQAFFPLNVNEDGDYGIRFVGPGEEPAQRVLAFPERTYHVDTVQPEVQVLVDPEQAEYHVGDLVSIDWMVQDFQLAKHPVTIEVLYDRGDTAAGPIEFQRDLPDEGSIAYSIPPEALGREITFRIEARDKTGNLGLAYTGTLRVVEDPTAVAQAKIQENENESEIDPTDRLAIVARHDETNSDATVPVAEEEPTLIVGPILVPVGERAEEVVATPTIDADLVVVDNSSETTAEEQRIANEALHAEASQLAAEMKLRATMFASRVIDQMDGVVSSWATSAKMAIARRRESTQSPPPVTVAVVEAPTAEAEQPATIRNDAAIQEPAPIAVAAVEADDTGAGDVAIAENPDQPQAAPTFAVVDQPDDESDANEAIQEALAANVVETEEENTSTSSAGSTFFEVGPRIVMTDDFFQEEPDPCPPSSDAFTAVALSDEDMTDQLDSTDAPETAPPRQDATSLAMSDNDMADEAEDTSPDPVAPRSSELPFATALARLPAIDFLTMDEDPAAEDFPADDAAARGPDIAELPSETIEPMQEEDAHPQVSALASAEQEADGQGQTDDDQLVDATMTEEADDANDGQEEDSPTTEILAAEEQSEEQDSLLPALTIQSLIAIDPTRGNGLLIPLPATLGETGTPPAQATGHPWRILGRHSDSIEPSIWALPERQSDVKWRPVFTGRFPADDPGLRDVAEPGIATQAKLAGTTEETIDGEASDEP